MTINITIHKGGTGEHVIDLRTHHVPDAWHAIQRMSRNTTGVGQSSLPKSVTDADLLLEVWYLAHALRDHILEQNNA